MFYEKNPIGNPELKPFRTSASNWGVLMLRILSDRETRGFLAGFCKFSYFPRRISWFATLTLLQYHWYIRGRLLITPTLSNFWLVVLSFLNRKLHLGVSRTFSGSDIFLPCCILNNLCLKNHKKLLKYCRHVIGYVAIWR